METIKNDEFGGFKCWLMKNKNYKEKSAWDVISRIRRSEQFIKIPEEITLETLFLLEQNQEFSRLTVSVKSQIRKALRFLMEFRKCN